MNATNIIKADELAVKVCKVLDIDPGKVRRVVLDIAVGEPVVAYIELYGDERLLTDIEWLTDGIKIVSSSEVSTQATE